VTHPVDKSANAAENLGFSRIRGRKAIVFEDCRKKWRGNITSDGVKFFGT
jgi:hypothetical protein